MLYYRNSFGKGSKGSGLFSSFSSNPIVCRWFVSLPKSRDPHWKASAFGGQGMVGGWWEAKTNRTCLQKSTELEESNQAVLEILQSSSLPACPTSPPPCKPLQAPQETSQFWATMCETWGLWGATSAFRPLAYALDVSCSDVTSELNTDSFLPLSPRKTSNTWNCDSFPLFR